MYKSVFIICVYLWSMFQSPQFDLLIKNGRIVDGSGRPSYVADVAIKGDRIVSIGKLSSATATRTKDPAHARSVEEAKDLATNVLLLGLLVVHDAVRGGEHDVAELTRRQHIVGPSVHLRQRNVEARADHTGLVDPARV